MKVRSPNSVPMQNRPVMDGLVLAFDKRVTPPAPTLKRSAGTLHLPKLTLVKTDRDER